MRVQLQRLRERAHGSLWIVPALFVLVSIALSLALQQVDRMVSSPHDWFAFRGGPSGAREVLSAIASSMMSFTGLVFSITILVLQLASNQFSPRVLANFLRDTQSKITLGIFIGTFVYALLALHAVRGESDDLDSFVPSLTVWLGLVLAVVSVGAFVTYLDHIAQSIRAVKVVGRIAEQSRASLDALYPEDVGDDASDPTLPPPDGSPSLLVTHAGESGVLVGVDEDALLGHAREADVVLRMLPRMGDFVPHGSVVFAIHGDARGVDPKLLARAIATGSERTFMQDTAFGIRQLVDVAERALSPGTNDPTTAVQAIDAIHDVLRRLVVRRFPSPVRQDEHGRVRLVLPRPGWEDYVHLAFDELREYGGGSLQVMRRLRFLAEDLLELAPPFRRAPLRVQLELLDGAVRSHFSDAREAAMARTPSRQGHGPLDGGGRATHA